MQNSNGSSKGEASVFYCQVDTFLGVKDYLRGGRCVRLIGVNESDYASLSQGVVGDGITSLVVDLDLAEYIRRFKSTLWSRRRYELPYWLAAWEDLSLSQRHWVRLEVQVDANGLSYYYPTFSYVAPTKFQLLNVDEVEGPELAPLLQRSARPPSFMRVNGVNEKFQVAPMPAEMKGASPYKFSAFHVGQGMCSVAYNDSTAVLFDAGAGTPITRKRYLTEPSFINGLRVLLKKRTVQYMVLSHYDHDHWRLLAWDEDLRNKVMNVIAPDVPGVSVAFFDKKMVGKVHKWSSLNLKLGASGKVSARRSIPGKVDSNGECLVSLVNLGRSCALVPGDYVYMRIASDGDAWIANLKTLAYSAVIVPHHGDEASALNVPTAANNAKAFFSAGDHTGYNHPHPASGRAHANAGYAGLHDGNQKHIVEVPLL